MTAPRVKPREQVLAETMEQMQFNLGFVAACIAFTEGDLKMSEIGNGELIGDVDAALEKARARFQVRP